MIPTYTFSCGASVVLLEEIAVFLATDFIGCDLGMKVTEPTVNVELLKNSSNSVIRSQFNLQLVKVFLDPELLFRPVEEKTVVQKGPFLST